MESSPSWLLPIEAAAPVAPYLGGKRNLASRIIERLAAIPHVTYVEPFVGMGGVFLRRPFRARSEVITTCRAMSPPCSEFSSGTTSP